VQQETIVAGVVDLGLVIVIENGAEILVG